MFNYSQVLGAGAGVTISNFYYPRPERSVANGFRNWGEDVGYDALNRLFVEFWPDISNAITHMHAPHRQGRRERRTADVPCRSAWPVAPETPPGCRE
jgi:hypothetical protein